MNREELKQCLEDALRSIPSISGNTSITGSEEGDNGYVACNRKGRRGSPKTVYKLENYGNGVRLSLLVRNTPSRVNILARLFRERNVGIGTYVILEDFGVHSKEMPPSSVRDMVKTFYEAYDAELMS